MDDALTAYTAGRADGLAARRDPARAADPVTGADYRVGFLDARIEIFRLHVEARRIAENPE